MKKIIALSLLTTLVFAKFPHESDARTIKDFTEFTNLQIAQQSTQSEVNWEYSRADMEGKILAAEYLMKKDIVDELKVSIFELLRRSSTVLKNNYEALESQKIHGIEEFLGHIKKIDHELMLIDLDESSLNKILELDEEVKELQIRFEEL